MTATAGWAGVRHGLQVRSDWPAPGLRPASHAPADVRITAGAVPLALDRPRYQRVAAEATADELLVRLPGVARVSARAGRLITVDWDGPPRPSALAAFLDAAVWSAVLQQRGRLVLRGAAVRLGAGALLVAGASGSGTSSLAAALAVNHGAVVVADTVVAVDVVGGRPVVWPGPPGIELWPTAVAALGLPAGPHGGVGPAVRCLAAGDRSATPVDPEPVTALFVLGGDDGHPTAALLPVTGAAGFLAVTAVELRPERATVFAWGRVARFAAAAALTTTVDLWRVRRCWHPWSVEAVAAVVAAAAP